MLAWVALLTALGCGAERTELVVVVDSDFPVPGELDQVEIAVTGPSGETRSESMDLAPGTLPLILYLEPGGSRLEPVDVVARGRRTGSAVVERRVRTGFVRGQSRLVYLVLRRNCAGVACGADETCTERGCSGVDVAGPDLPRWTGEPPPLMPFDGDAGGGDGGMDAGTADAGSEDAGGMDAAVPDAGPPLPDSGPTDTGPDTGCPARMGDCDGNPMNGCEQALTALAHCGACGVVCDLPHARETCTSGSCELLMCEAGYEDCNGLAADGCEASLDAPESCGRCGRVCALAHVTAHTCTGGSCGVGTCEAGWADCNGTAADGCEQALTTLAHCGSCGSACMLDRATEECGSGTCRIASCDLGFGDCDATAANGCERPLDTLADCGACGRTCMLDRALESCMAGTCMLGACDAGYANCDAMAATGCETNIATDPSNCGGCGNVCMLPRVATETCSGGACGVGSCDPGWANCDADPLDGCEVSLMTLANCGMCGRRCVLPNATPSCATGSCEIATCNPGFADCDMTDANGCEVNVNNSVMNCGMCGRVCSLPGATAACMAGTCTTAMCLPGFGQCDGIATNGCEPLSTFYVDADGDGYGNPGAPMSACTMPMRYVSNNTDCNDGDASINPGSPEPLGCNGVDNDCDGMIDDGVDGCSCMDPVVVMFGTTYDGVTCNTNDFLSSTCGPATEGDTVFLVRLTMPRTVVITVTGGDDEVDVVYRGTTCPGAVVTCNAHVGMVMRALSAGDHYFQVTPDHASCYSPYTIRFTLV